MKLSICKIIYSMCLVGLLQCQSSWGQSIVGDTIYVNHETDIGVKFPTRPSSFYTTPGNAPYNLASYPPSGFTISAKFENTPEALLFVNEGNNAHQFILAFKKDINFNNAAELLFDYSTKAKLEKRVKELEAKKAVAFKHASSPPAVNVQSTNTSNAQSSTVSPIDTNAKYNTIMELGQRNMDLGLYHLAQMNYERALDFKPNEKLPRQRLDEIRIKRGETALDGNKNQQFTRLTIEGKAQFDMKDYARSKELYKKALQLRPGDLSTLTQLEKIDKILNSQKTAQEQKNLKDLHTSYMQEGEKALAKNQLPEARIAFEQALTIMPGDPAAEAKIKIVIDKEKREKEAGDIETNYLTIVDSADKLYLKRDYTNAKIGYTKALTIFRREWPQEQIDNINKILADQEAEKVSAQRRQVKQAELERQEQAAREIENRYAAVILKADKLFDQGDYAKAKIEYTNAIQILNKSWPNDQLEKIKQKQEEQTQTAVNERQRAEAQKKEREQQEQEKKYATIIRSADEYFLDSNYNQARAEYTRAKTILKRPWPDEQIARIDNISAERSAAEKKERARRENEIRVTTEYNTLIKKADAEFDRSSYTKARQLYGAASQLKPGEPYPVERIQVIQNATDNIAKAEKERADSIATANELKRRFSLAVSRGKSSYLKGDFENAKHAYEEAVALRPSDAESISQLQKVKNQLAEIEKEKEMNARYDKLITEGDSLLVINEYEEARASFKEAARIKPSEAYPSRQVTYIYKEIINKGNADSLERYRQSQSRYRKAIRNGDQAVAEKRFSVAVASYNEALAINPENETVKRGRDIAKHQYEQQKIKYDQEQEQLKTSVRQLPLTSKKKKKNDKAPVVQKPLDPYTLDQLNEKYPTINFANFPSTQPLSTDPTHITTLEAVAHKIYSENPRLDLSVMDQSVKLVCQGLFFKDKMTTLRLLIQNNGQTDFLTGAMMLTWTKSIGARVRIFPVFIYPGFLPVIKPGQEALVVYVCKAYAVEESDNLEFELNDRLEKVKLTLPVPGKLYIAEAKK